MVDRGRRRQQVQQDVFGFAGRVRAAQGWGRVSTACFHSRSVAREGAASTNTAGAAMQSDHEPFSHRRHAALKLQCAYCHVSAAKSDRAGFPEAGQCMTCHSAIAKDKPAIQALASYPPAQKITPVTAVYRLPDFIFFRHRQHVGKGIACSACHGDVWTQDQNAAGSRHEDEGLRRLPPGRIRLPSPARLADEICLC